MIREAIVLAGGLGKRLRSAVPGLPKCMAPVGGKPFLHYLIRYFSKQGIHRFIFSLGYLHEVIEEFLEAEFAINPAVEYACCTEEEPLGTGGAIKKAATLATSENVLVLNGDTFFEVGLAKISALHEQKKADCVLSLKPMTDTERYGVVDIDADQQITRFREKQWYDQGLINGGVYALHLPSFAKESFPDRFSFESDYLQAFFAARRFFGSVQEGYFIDIGIPDDFNKANNDFINFPL